MSRQVSLLNGRTFPIITDKQLLQAARFSLEQNRSKIRWSALVCSISMEWSGRYQIEWHSQTKRADEEKKLIHLTSLALYTVQRQRGVITWAYIENKWSIIRLEELPICLPNHYTVQQKTFDYLEETQFLSVDRQSVRFGADPEWLALAPNGQAIRMDRFFDRDATIGFDCVRSHGVDWPILLELRPAPQKSAYELLLELKSLLNKASLQIGAMKSVKLFAGAYPLRGIPLGGHLHVQGIPMTQSIVRQFDMYLTFPLCAIEPIQARKRRPRFGRVGDVQRKSSDRFEYRTLPNWMVEPAIAEGVLTVTDVLIRYIQLKSNEELECFDENARYAWWRTLFAYYHGERSFFQRILSIWWERIRSFCMTQQEWIRIQRYYSRLQSGQHWDEQIDQISLWYF